MKLIKNAEYRKEVFELFEKAKREILIFAFDFKEGKKELAKAKKRGVDVRVIAETKRSFANIKGLNFKIKKVRSSRVMHSKACIIDRKIAIIGSHNFSKRAFSSNIELSVMTKEEKIVQELKDYFEFWWNY